VLDFRQGVIVKMFELLKFVLTVVAELVLRNNPRK